VVKGLVFVQTVAPLSCEFNQRYDMAEMKSFEEINCPKCGNREDKDRRLSYQDLVS